MAYKINVKLTGMGWEMTLYKKFLWFIYIPDTITVVRCGHERRVDEKLQEWTENFSIPESKVSLPHSIKHRYYEGQHKK